MPIDASFKAAINVLAELASDNHPAYVRVNAAGRLANILSPANPKYNDIIRDLNAESALPATPMPNSRSSSTNTPTPATCVTRSKPRMPKIPRQTKKPPRRKRMSLPDTRLVLCGSASFFLERTPSSNSPTPCQVRRLVPSPGSPDISCTMSTGRTTPEPKEDRACPLNESKLPTRRLRRRPGLWRPRPL